jgi:hypothetical protein
MLNQQRDDLRVEVAAAAARLIAEDGLDYASAKHKAALSILGAGAPTRAALPDNAQIEFELRRYLATFVPAHAQVLAALRELALQLMRRLERFRPHVVGAVLNGTATEHSDIHLQLFVDSAKDVELFLHAQGVDFEAAAAGRQAGEPMETLHLLVRPARARGMPPRVGVVVDLYAAHDIRKAPKYRSAAPDLHPVETCGRADAAMLERLIADRAGADVT